MKFKTLIAFLALKSITDSAFQAMPEAEKMELYKEYNETLKADFEAAIDKMVTREAFEAAQKSNDFEAVKALAMKLETEIEALKEAPKNTDKAAPRNLAQALKAAFTENKHFNDVANGEQQTAPIVVKASAVTMGLDNTIEAVGSESQISITQNTGIISAIRQRITKYLGGGVSVGVLQGNKAMWIEELDEEGEPIFIGEGDTKTQLSVRYEERDAKARKIGVHGKVTTEMMRNLPALINYIQNNLMRRVDIVTETGLFSGPGTGNTLNGLIQYATAFTGGGLLTTDPSYADVFRALALQVVKANGVASAIYVTPDVLAAMDVEKTVDGFYLMPPFRAANGNVVAGCRLIETNALPITISGTKYDFVGGDLSVVNVLFSDAMSVQIGTDGNDFIQNLKTILVEQELVQFVSANDAPLLVKGNMAAAVAAITQS
jgi:hypothetical protein